MMVRPAGIEPATPCLEGRCSIQAELRPHSLHSTADRLGTWLMGLILGGSILYIGAHLWLAAATGAFARAVGR